MSGIFVRCPNCGREIRVELMMIEKDGAVGIDPDFSDLAEHARNCAEENG